MKRGRILSWGLAALAMMVSACSQSSNPISSNDGANPTGSQTGQPGILAKLQDPEVSLQTNDSGGVQVKFTAGASGTSDSESMRAARIIEMVEFQIRNASDDVVDRTTTTNVFTTGVKGPDDIASLTVVADTQWVPERRVSDAAVLVAVVHGRNGEVLVTRSPIEPQSGT